MPTLSYLTIAYIVGAVFAIIELALTAYIASRFRWGWGGVWSYSSPRVNFMVFNSVWSLLVLAYLALAPTYAGALFHRLVAAAITGVTAVFWFAGAIALAVVAGGGVWGAAAAFGFFLWVVFTGLFVLDVLENRRGPMGPQKNTPSANPGV